jgi:U6 snRNA-associated Sm-like protein LSm6
MEQHKKTPQDFLKMIKGRPVNVKLNDGSEYRGIFICLDGCLNIVLEKCEEVIEGKVINKFKDLFIRGNNVSYISPLKQEVE